MMRAAEAGIGEADGRELERSGGDADEIGTKVGDIVKTFAKGDLAASDNLEAAGFSSLDFVNLMLTIEESFGVKIPSARMTPGNFRTIQSIAALLRSLTGRA
jgi:acyl carrier protein